MEPDTKKSRVSIVGMKSQTKSMVAMGPKSISRMKVRKQSFGFNTVAGVRPVEARGSQVGIEFKRPPLLYLNTYQLDSKYRFNEAAVLKAANSTIEELFSEHVYNMQESPLLALRIAGEIMRNVKAMGFNRYRIIAVVTLAQRRAQSYNNAISFLWDHERDSYVDIHKEVNTAFLHCTVFGVYLD